MKDNGFVIISLAGKPFQDLGSRKQGHLAFSIFSSPREEVTLLVLGLVQQPKSLVLLNIVLNGRA